MEESDNPRKTVWRMAKWLGRCGRIRSLLEGELKVVLWPEEVVVVPDLGMESLDNWCSYGSLKRVMGMQVGRVRADVWRRSVLWLQREASG